MTKIYHWCLPNADNLGDTLCQQALNDILHDPIKPAQIDTLDLLPLCGNITKWLDDDIPRINKDYDAIIIGPGGLLSFAFLAYIFKFEESWDRLKIPIILFGVGIIGNHPEILPQAYAGYSNLHSLNHEGVVDGHKVSLEANYISALKRADLISVRDRPSWSLVNKYKKPDSSLFLTGCPTLFNPKVSKNSTQKSYDLAINITFSHSGLCQKYRQPLANIAINLASFFPKSVWICHSSAEETEAKNLLASRGLDIPVVTPKSFEDVAGVYSQCKTAIVTKLHAAYFCLANNVPFSFISYDIKCDYLLDMLYDYTAPYNFNLLEIENYKIERKLESFVRTLSSHAVSMKSAEAELFRTLEKENKVFINAVKKLIK